MTIGLGGWAIARQASRDRCAKIAQQVDQAWTPARRHKVHDALLGSRPEQTGTMAAHVVEVLDRYAEQLREGRRDACEATLVQDEQPEAVMVKRLRCLDIRQHQLDAHVELLEQADPAIVERSIDLAHELGPVRPCANPQTLALEAAPPDDPTARAEVEQIRDGLARVRALTIAGRYTQAHTQTDDWLARARASGHDPVLIEALNERARTSLNVDAHDQALALAREAYVLSDRGARPAAVETLLVMGRALGVNGHLDAALLEYRRALALQRQIEPQPTAKEGELLNLIGMTLSSLERKDEALDHFERARAIWLDIGDSSETVDAAALGNIANLHVDADQLERGIAEWEQVLAIRTEHLGPHHLRVAIAHNNYAFALEHANRYTDANTHYARAIAIIESMPDSEHTLARLHDNIGHNLHMQGRLDEAMRALTRARQIYASRPDSNPAYVAANLQHLGQVTRQTGPLDDALAYFRRALELRRGIFGPDHPALASQHHGIGRVLLMQGDAAAALTEHRAALDLQSELTPPHRALATTHAYLGIALLSTGRASDALTELEQAHSTLVALGEERQHRALTVLRGLADVHLALRDTEAAVQWATTALDIASEQHSPLAIASGQFTLATVLWSVDRSRAEALLAEAEASMRSMGTTTDFQRLSQWKASHP